MNDALVGRFVTLHEIATDADLDAALRVINAGDNPRRWRTGKPYTRRQLGRELDNCYAKFAVQARGRDVGMIEVLGVDLSEHVAHVGFILDPRVQRALWPWEGMAIALEWLFGQTELSPPDEFYTMQFETSGLNVEQFAKRDHGLFTPLGYDEDGDVYEYAVTRVAWFNSTMRARWCRRSQRRETMRSKT